MGFFDNLLDILFSREAFTDETVKKYYEVSYGLLVSVGGDGVNFEGIKKYIEHCLGGLCDSEKLQAALMFFANSNGLYSLYRDEGNLTRTYKAHNIPKRKTERILEMNRTFEQQMSYRCSKKEAYDICYKEIVDDIEIEYKKILDVVAENGVEHFREGVSRIKRKYTKITGEEVIKECIHTLTYNSFFANNVTVEKILLTYLYSALHTQKREDVIASVALRALHFEKYGTSEDGYTTIKEENCRDFVLNNDYYKSQIAKTPYDKAEHIDKYIRLIMQAGIFHIGGISLFANVECWMPRQKTEFYYTDILCSRYCKYVSRNYVNVDLTNPQDLYDMLWNNINK